MKNPLLNSEMVFRCRFSVFTSRLRFESLKRLTVREVRDDTLALIRADKANL